MVATKSPTIRSWAVLPKSGVLIYLGHRGKGKSALAWWLAEQAHKVKRRVIAYDFTPAARAALPKWVKHCKTLAELSKAPSSVVVVDEAALKANARRSQSANNVEWTRLVAIARHKDHLLMFIGQHGRQIDVSLVTDADMVLMKEPSLLHLRFARPELKPELDQAWEMFQKAKGDKRKKTFVVSYHTGATGFLSNGLPTFWSERLSKAFAAVELEASGATARRRVQRAAIAVSSNGRGT